MAATAKNWHRINVWPTELTAEDASRDQGAAGAKQLKRLSVYRSTTVARANTAWTPIGRTVPRRRLDKPPEPDKPDPPPEPDKPTDPVKPEPQDDEEHRAVPRHQRERDKR